MRKDGRGPWYWFSMSNLLLMLAAMSGLFGVEAKDDAQAALRDVNQVLPVLVLLVVAVVLVAAVIYLATS